MLATHVERKCEPRGDASRRLLVAMITSPTASSLPFSILTMCQAQSWHVSTPSAGRPGTPNIVPLRARLRDLGSAGATGVGQLLDEGGKPVERLAMGCGGLVGERRLDRLEGGSLHAALTTQLQMGSDSASSPDVGFSIEIGLDHLRHLTATHDTT